MASNKKRILSGVRPTGPLHLGHYVGNPSVCVYPHTKIAETLVAMGAEQRQFTFTNEFERQWGHRECQANAY